MLLVVEEIPAGSVPTKAVGPGLAARIMTGAPMPEGADVVVKIEDTEPAGEGGTVAVRVAAQAGANVRFRGEDVRSGDEVLGVGETMTPAAVALAAATGHASVWVHRRPVVAVLATGDELVEPGEVPGPGQIRDSNSHGLAAQVAAAGGLPLRYDIVRDDEASVRAALGRAAEEADVIVSSGGVSVGDYDVVRDVLTRVGRLEFWSVAMRPGSPVTFGEYRGRPFFGLPGNPTSSFVGFELFTRPALRKMQGFAELERPHVIARADARRAQTARARALHPRRAHPHARRSGSGLRGLLGREPVLGTVERAAPGQLLPDRARGGRGAGSRRARGVHPARRRRGHAVSTGNTIVASFVGPFGHRARPPSWRASSPRSPREACAWA